MGSLQSPEPARHLYVQIPPAARRLALRHFSSPVAQAWFTNSRFLPENLDLPHETAPSGHAAPCGVKVEGIVCARSGIAGSPSDGVPSKRCAMLDLSR